MKNFLALAVCVVACATIEAQSMRVTADLDDGSTLIGTLKGVQAVPFRTALGRIEVPLKCVDRITASSRDEHVAIEFLNGDRLTGFLGIDTLNLHTAVGAVAIPISRLKVMWISPIADLHPEVTDGLAIYYAFDVRKGGASPTSADATTSGEGAPTTGAGGGGSAVACA